MKKKMFTIISMVLEVVVVASLFFPYIAGAKSSIWQSFGNSFAIVGVTFSVVGFIGSLFKKNELNYLVCGYYIGIHIYNFSILHTNEQFMLPFSALGLGFYVQVGGSLLLLLATFISSFFNKKETVMVQEKRNNTEVKTTVNNGQMNMPVNSFKSLPVENKEEEKTMPKPDLLSGVKQNDDSLFVNSNLFVSAPTDTSVVNTGPSLFDHIHVPNQPPQMIENNNIPSGMMTMPEPIGMPGGMINTPEINPSQHMMAPEPIGMPGGMINTAELNTSPQMMPPSSPVGMPGGLMSPSETNAMPQEMTPAPEVNSMPQGMLAPQGPQVTPQDIATAPEVNSMPQGMLAPQGPQAMPQEMAAPQVVNSMPADMMTGQIPVAPQEGLMGGLPQPSQEGGADIQSIMNEGPSVEEQLKMFTEAQQAPDPGVPKPDLLAGSNLSGVLGNDSNGNLM